MARRQPYDLSRLRNHFANLFWRCAGRRHRSNKKLDGMRFADLEWYLRQAEAAARAPSEAASAGENNAVHAEVLALRAVFESVYGDPECALSLAHSAQAAAALDHLRRHIIETIADTHAVTLATFGPADLQASIVRCEASQTHLFVLVPRASDHLFNLEGNPQVVITANGWEMRGTARIVPR